jgi:hypothetical protein
MDLETRVTALENDVATLRVETRGWAAIAVSADGKASMAGEMLTHIYDEVRQTRATLARHGETLARHGETLDRHGETLDRHGETLDRHTEMLREILRRLPEPT